MHICIYYDLLSIVLLWMRKWTRMLKDVAMNWMHFTKQMEGLASHAVTNIIKWINFLITQLNLQCTLLVIGVLDKLCVNCSLAKTTVFLLPVPFPSGETEPMKFVAKIVFVVSLVCQF